VEAVPSRESDPRCSRSLLIFVRAGLEPSGDQVRRFTELDLPSMASTTCWDCGQVAHMTPVEGAAVVKTADFFRHRVMGCFRCDGCGAFNIAIALGNPKSSDSALAWLAGRKKLEWVPKEPKKLQIKPFPDVPTPIAAAATEAYTCRLGNNCRAAVLLARSVIEATAKDKGITKKTLIAKIDAMLEQGLIRPHVRDGAHEVRYLGNEMAHGDLAQSVSPADADLVLTLMSEVLDDVYESPARVERAKAGREARQLQADQLAALAQGKPLPAVSPAVASILQAWSQGAVPGQQPTRPSASRQAKPSSDQGSS